MGQYITTGELSSRIKYDARYIRNCLLDSVFIEGVHYIRPFGRRKILFIWEAIEGEMHKASNDEIPIIPLRAGGAIHG
ncbi:hypothetical protein [Mariprofundus ferrooxydans]|nr:hypothetical protein [Mariprofundus ferrooxydans]